MRYKEYEVPPEQLAVNASNDMLILTAFIGVIVGILLFILGRKGKQMWMWTWGIGLVIFSVYLGVGIKFGVKLFGYF